VLKVYVSGPYSKGDPVLNVRDAVHAADRLWAAGFAPFVPHVGARKPRNPPKKITQPGFVTVGVGNRISGPEREVVLPTGPTQPLARGAVMSDHHTPPLERRQSKCRLCGRDALWLPKRGDFSPYCSAECRVKGSAERKSSSLRALRRPPMPAPATDKRCAVCRRRKPFSEFTRNGRTADGLEVRCRLCKKRKAAESRARHREVLRRRQAEWRRSHPEQVREMQRRNVRQRIVLKYRYGLDPEVYRAMIASQDGKCAICGEPPDPSGSHVRRVLCVDHDHASGEIRGLLCYACNVAIGHFRDNPELMRLAAKYLEHWHAKSREVVS
jgi:hypothetical protein